MKVITTILIFASLLSLFYTNDTPHVIQLNNTNFDKIINTNEYTLVKFYAPWCGHCKSLIPVYEKASQNYENNSKIKFAQIDATESLIISEKYDITGYPTILLFYNNTQIFTDYEGDRTSDDIAKFIDNKINSIKIINNINELDSLKNQDESIVLLIGNQVSKEYNIMKEIAFTFKYPVIYAFTDNQEIKNMLAKNDTELILFSKKTNDTIYYKSSPFENRSVEEFIITNTIPDILEYNEQTLQMLLSSNRPMLVLYRNKDIHINEELLIRSLANSFKSKLVTVICGFETEVENVLVEYVGIKRKDIATLKIHVFEGENIKGYSFNMPFNIQNIETFITDFSEGKLKEDIKSQEVPKENNGDILDIVSFNFEEEVLLTTQDVFVLFYAPWCNYCKEVMPIYEQLANKLKNNKNLKFTRIDYTENEVENINIKGFPTFYFYKSANKKNPIEYTEERTESDFINFLNKHTNIEEIKEIDKTDL